MFMCLIYKNLYPPEIRITLTSPIRDVQLIVNPEANASFCHMLSGRVLGQVFGKNNNRPNVVNVWREICNIVV